MRIACLVCLFCLALACKEGTLPGTDVGTYAVKGSLLDNTCGNAALPTEDTLNFQVEIRRLGPESGLWILGKPPGTEGTLRADGSFVFTRTSTHVAVEPESQQDVIRNEEPIDYWTGAVLSNTPDPGCAFTIEERIEGSLVLDSADAGSPDASTSAVALTALNEITVIPTLGSSCQAALVENGGPFYDFPCSARYDLTGDLLP